MTNTNSAEELNPDEIDLSSVFAIIWKRRKLIVLGTLGATLLSIGVSLLFSRVYRSEGFFQVDHPINHLNLPENKTANIGMPITFYKSSSSLFFDPNRFQMIAKKNKSFKQEDLMKIENSFKTAADIIKWFKPVYAFAKEDAREFSQFSKDESNTVIGLNLAYEANSPESASAYVGFFGNYIRDCLLYVVLYNYIIDGYSRSASAMAKTENEVIGIQFELLQYTNKAKDIRAILTNYPESEKMESRQLVSVQEGGARFLAPVTQLVGIESALADVRRSLAKLERDREKLSVRTEFFSRCFSEIQKTGESGDALFLLLKSIKDEVFKNKDLGNDAVKEVFNNLSIDLQAFDLTFLSNSRFISGPTMPTIHIRPHRSIIVITSCLVAFFALVVSSFILHWWQSNKKEILAS